MDGPLDRAQERYEITSPVRQCCFLPNVAIESGWLRYTRELWGPTLIQRGYDKRADLGNTKAAAIAAARAKGQPVGFFLRGAGLIQLTGWDNLLAFSKHAFDDDRVARDPDLLNDPELAARSAAYFWWSHGCNELAEAGKFDRTCSRVNGPRDPEKVLHIAERRLAHARCKTILMRTTN